MKFPKEIDFTNIVLPRVFDKNTEQYKIFNQIPDVDWGEYVNKMLSKGISVVYDAQADTFTAKENKMKKESRINSNRTNIKEKMEINEWRTYHENGDDPEEDIQDDYQLPSPWEEKDDKKDKKKELDEDEDKYLLFDEEDPEEDDFDGIDLDDDINSVLDADDFEQEDEFSNEFDFADESDQVQPDIHSIMNQYQITIEDLRQILDATSQNNNNTSSQVGPQSSPLNDFTGNEGELDSSDEGLKAVYGQTDNEVLDTDFAEVQDEISIAENKIETEPSYYDYLSGEVAIDKYNKRTDTFDDEASYLEDDEDFKRNATLVSGTDEEEFLDYPETAEVLESAEDAGELDEPMANVLDYEEDNDESLSPTLSNRAPEQTINKTVSCCGMPVQIVLTGVIITPAELNYIGESAKRESVILKRIESKEKDKLNIIIETKGRTEVINYIDVDKLRNKYPYTTKTGKHQSLTEAIRSLTVDVRKEIVERENVTKFLTEDLNSRSFSEFKSSTIMEGFENIDISSWNIKSVGSVNLKTGMNEKYSDVTQHSKEKNTLVKTSNNQYMLFKGNLKDRSKLGVKKELVEGKQSYGKGEVIGIYENNLKGLGQIMFKTKRTSLPLFIWK